MGTWDTTATHVRKRGLMDGDVTHPNRLLEMFSGILQKTVAGHKGCGSLCLSFPIGFTNGDMPPHAG